MFYNFRVVLTHEKVFVRGTPLWVKVYPGSNEFWGIIQLPWKETPCMLSEVYPYELMKQITRGTLYGP